MCGTSRFWNSKRAFRKLLPIKKEIYPRVTWVVQASGTCAIGIADHGRSALGLRWKKTRASESTGNPRRVGTGPIIFRFMHRYRIGAAGETLLVGDYQMQIGQGLVLSAGFVLGKSAETVQTVRRPTLGARPYTSLTEYGYFRGATATYAFHKNVDITLLASRNHRDANTAPDNAEGLVATSLQTSGLHRTQSELDDRGSLLETNLGVHLLYHTPNQAQLGLTVLQTTFDTFFRKRDLAYNQYEFTGKQNLVVGLHGGYIWQNWNFFGEVAHSSGSTTNSGGVGAVGGALASLTKKLDMALALRHYDRNFHSFYSNAFSEGSRNSNESGAYLGLKYTVYRKLTLGGFVDVYKFPWLKYLIDKPSSGFRLSALGTLHAQQANGLLRSLPRRAQREKPNYWQSERRSGYHPKKLRSQCRVQIVSRPVYAVKGTVG